jgi:hypothetical protein
MGRRILCVPCRAARTITATFIYSAVATILANLVLFEIAGISYSRDTLAQWRDEAIAVGAKYISVPLASLLTGFLFPSVNSDNYSLVLLACRGLIAPIVQVLAFLCIGATNGAKITIAEVAGVYWSLTFYRFGSLFAKNMIGHCIVRSEGAIAKWFNRNAGLQIMALMGIMSRELFGCLYACVSLKEKVQKSIGTAENLMLGQIKATIIDDFLTYFIEVFDIALQIFVRTDSACDCMNA